MRGSARMHCLPLSIVLPPRRVDEGPVLRYRARRVVTKVAPAWNFPMIVCSIVNIGIVKNGELMEFPAPNP